MIFDKKYTKEEFLNFCRNATPLNMKDVDELNFDNKEVRYNSNEKSIPKKFYNEFKRKLKVNLLDGAKYSVINEKKNIWIIETQAIDAVLKDMDKGELK